MTDTAELPPFVARMKDELNGLRIRANALDAFLEGEAFKALSEVDQSLLEAQHSAMVAYERILALRLGKFV